MVLVLLGIFRPTVLMIILADKGSVRFGDHHRRSLSSTHFALQRGQGAKGRKRSAAPVRPPQGRHYRLAGVNMLHDVGGAATIEQVNIKMVWETVTSSTLRSSAPLQSQTPILLCPQPLPGANGIARAEGLSRCLAE